MREDDLLNYLRRKGRLSQKDIELFIGCSQQQANKFLNRLSKRHDISVIFVVHDVGNRKFLVKNIVLKE